MLNRLIVGTIVFIIWLHINPFEAFCPGSSGTSACYYVGYCKTVNVKFGITIGCDDCICPDNYTGDCCENGPPNSNPCDPNPCPSYGRHRCLGNKAGLYRCECLPGFTGENCDTAINPCNNPYPCGIGAANCTVVGNSYQCYCKPGYKGNKCEEYTGCLLPGCLLQPGPCETKGKNYCKNGGTCADVDGNSISCICPQAYSGPQCQYTNSCSDSYCGTERGMCIYDNRPPIKPPNPRCECINTWIGDKCETWTYCGIKKCQNGATCKDTNAWSATCLCAAGYTGEFCEEIINNCDPNPCQFGGTCKNKIADYDCICPCGTSGKSCEYNEDDCHNPDTGKNYCQKSDKRAVCNDGNCDFTCTCSPDYTGPNCTMLMIVWDLIKQFEGGDGTMENILNDIVTNPSLIKDLIPFLLALEPIENQTSTSWKYDDLFLWASFEGTELNIKKDIVKSYQTSLGNCFTFNHPNSTTDYNLRYSGEKGGFKTLMRVREDEYLSWIDTSALLVFVHSKFDSIMGESVRYQAGPGDATTLFVRKNVYSRLGLPYGRCVKDKSEVESFYYNGAYSVDGCFRSCYQDVIEQNCACMDPRYPVAPNSMPCNLDKRNCVLNVTTVKGDASSWPECECPPPCKEDKYDIRWTRTVFKSDTTECDKFSNDPEKFDKCLMSYNDKALISVQFPRLTVKVFKEKPEMKFTDILNQLQNLGGLLIGLSIIMFLEFGYLIVRIVAACFFKDTKVYKHELH